MAPSTTEGSPALGRQVTGMAAWPVRWRSGSNISAGPVAQLSPMRSTSMASRAHRAAPISVPGQHGAGQLDGHLGLDGQADAGRLHGPPGPVDGRLGLQQVEDRLDDDQVDAALDEGRGLLLVGVAEVGVADLAEGGELGARSDAAGHPPGPVRGGEVVGRLAGQARQRPGSAPGPGGPGRTRPAPGRTPRRCRSRPRRTRPRRTTGGPGRWRRDGSPPAARCSPRGRARRSRRRSGRPAAGWCPWRRRRRPPARRRPRGSWRRRSALAAMAPQGYRGEAARRAATGRLRAGAGPRRAGPVPVGPDRASPIDVV